MPAQAGIVVGPGIASRSMAGGWTYMMASKPRGVLYTGVTASLAERVVQHRAGTGSAFCRRYGCKTLVLVEPHATILEAIAREKALKAWRREWKVVLVERSNPEWRDLFGDLAC
jgi:putative endonuclease